jgi:ketosteroid isomerase-like protein
MWNTIERTRRFASLAALATLAIAIAAMPARAPAATVEEDRAAAVAVIDGYFAAMNRADWAAAKTFYAPAMTIVDDDPPYTYDGKGAGARYVSRAAASVTGVTFTYAAPWYQTFKDGVLYAVYPVSASVRLKSGAGVFKSGLYTFVVQRSVGGWKISGMAWSATAGPG